MELRPLPEITMELLDRTKVIDALRYSASMDNQARVAAQSLLESYEALPNFLIILLVWLIIILIVRTLNKILGGRFSKI